VATGEQALRSSAIMQMAERLTPERRDIASHHLLAARPVDK
jgi:hypothetical protein